MFVKDEGCIAEQTILRYQTNNVAVLLGCEWYGIILLSPHDHFHVDTYNVNSPVKSELVLRLIRKFVTRDYLEQGAGECFDDGNEHIFTYPIRVNNKGYYIFFTFYKSGDPFDPRDISWYETYARTAMQRVLLENELLQDKKYVLDILEYSSDYIAVLDKNMKVKSASKRMQELLNKANGSGMPFYDMEGFFEIIKAVLTRGESKQEVPLKLGEIGNFLQLEANFIPISNSKGEIGAVFMLAKECRENC